MLPIQLANDLWDNYAQHVRKDIFVEAVEEILARYDEEEKKKKPMATDLLTDHYYTLSAIPYADRIRLLRQLYQQKWNRPLELKTAKEVVDEFISKEAKE